MCSSVKSLLTISDSIAIEILDKNAILTGVGNELHLHQTSNKTKVLDIRLENKVHGIIKGTGHNAGKIVIHGEKEFLILELLQKYEFKECYRGKLSDWIIAGKLYEKEQGFVLLTAHSVIVECKEDTEGGTYKIERRVSCADKSTLYCGFLSGNCWENLTVFGGNAFGELLIWQPKNAVKLDYDFMKADLSQRKAAHHGVIFSIDYDAEKSLLITTSDDRSIRFWQVLEPQDLSTAHFTPKASGYGHTARVFQGKIISYENTIFALTVSEDSYFCVWRFDDGELLFKKRHQFGAAIWRLAYSNENQTIYTVGCTSNILAFDLTSVLSKSEPRLHRTLKLDAAADGAKDEYIAKIKFFTKDKLIAVTNHNRLLLYDVIVGKWQTLATAHADFKYTVLEVCDNLIALCGLKFAIIYEFVGENLLKKFELNTEPFSAVIRSFCFLSLRTFIVSDNDGNCGLYKFAENSEEPICYAIKLPEGRERWLTAAIFFNEKFLVVSNRQGKLLLYAFENEMFEQIDILKHVHGYMGATLLKVIELQTDCAYVQSAGHNNKLKTLKVDFSETSLSLQSQEHTPIAWIEAVVQHGDTLDNDRQSYLGFNDNHFVIWSTGQEISVQIECGGGHRCWHFQSYVEAEKERIRLAFIKNKTVLLYDYPVYNELKTNINLPLRNRWHTRACNALELIENPAKNETIVISGGDDNLIKINKLSIEHDKAVLTQFAEVQTHISNVRALKLISFTPTKYLIFSGGGRAQLCITMLDLESYRICEILNYTLKTKEAQHTETSTSPQSHSFDPETRIMSIDVLPIDGEVFQVYAACSDGYLREFKANFKSLPKLSIDFEFVNAIYYGRCMLHVRLIAHSYLLTAATDGYIIIFDLEMTQTLTKLQLHKSGINSLDLNLNSETQLLHLLTGGDDQAVTLTKINFKNPNDPVVIEMFVLPNIHIAQVTAAKLIAGVNYLFAFTSGVDQNLVCFDLLAQEITTTIITQSCVADVKGLTLCKGNAECLLYGCGLQVLKLSSEE